MVGLSGIIFVAIPESPWWLVGKDRHEKALKVLHLCNGTVEGYDVQEQIVCPLLYSSNNALTPVGHYDSNNHRRAPTGAAR